LESITISLPSGRTNGRESSNGEFSSATGVGGPIHGPNAGLEWMSLLPVRVLEKYSACRTRTGPASPAGRLTAAEVRRRQPAVGKVRERGATPEVERLPQLLRRAVRMGVHLGPALRQQLLEAVDVPLPGADIQPIGAPMGLKPPVWPKRSPAGTTPGCEASAGRSAEATPPSRASCRPVPIESAWPPSPTTSRGQAGESPRLREPNTGSGRRKARSEGRQSQFAAGLTPAVGSPGRPHRSRTARRPRATACGARHPRGTGVDRTRG
jgi:hypothetical protein